MVPNRCIGKNSLLLASFFPLPPLPSDHHKLSRGIFFPFACQRATTVSLFLSQYYWRFGFFVPRLLIKFIFLHSLVCCYLRFIQLNLPHPHSCMNLYFALFGYWRPTIQFTTELTFNTWPV